MQKLLAILAVFILIFFGYDMLSNSNSLQQSIEEIAAGNANTPRLAGVQVVTIKGGEIHEKAATGFALIKADGSMTSMTTDHKVRIASISKLVLTLGLMTLVEQGDIDLEADINRYLDAPMRNPNHPNVPITLSMILSHTSSIRDTGGYFVAYKDGELMDFFKPSSTRWGDGSHWAGADQPPGVYFEYANINFGIVATIIENVSGTRFDRFMQERLFTPLGINASFNSCDIYDGSWDLLSATYRTRDSEGVWHKDGPWRSQVDGEPHCHYGHPALTRSDPAPDAGTIASDYALGSNAALFSPQGGLRISGRDLAKIMRLMIGGGSVDGVTILKAETIDTMLTARWVYDEMLKNGNSAGEDTADSASAGLMTSYGLSVHIIETANFGLEGPNRILYGHFGEAYGLLSTFLYDPITKNGVVIFLTGSAEDPSLFPHGSTPLYAPEELLLEAALNSIK